MTGCKAAGAAKSVQRRDVVAVICDDSLLTPPISSKAIFCSNLSAPAFSVSSRPDRPSLTHAFLTFQIPPMACLSSSFLPSKSQNQKKTVS